MISSYTASPIEFTIPSGYDNNVHIGGAFKQFRLSSDTASNVKSIRISRVSDISSLNKEQFKSKTSLLSIYIPTLKEIKDSTFLGCTGLYSLNVSGLISSDYCSFAKCTAISTISFDKLEYLGISALYGCTSLISVYMPSIKHIGESAFADCNSLEIVKIPTTEMPQLDNSNAFSGCDDNLEIYVNKDIWDQYMQSETWSTLSSNMCKDGDGRMLNNGTEISVKLVPNTGYEIEKLQINGNDFEGGKYTVSSQTEIYSKTRKISCTVTLANEPSYAGDTAGSGVYEYGTEVTLSAKPRQDWDFTKWSDGSTLSVRTMTLNENVSLTAQYTETITNLNVGNGMLKVGENSNLRIKNLKRN